MNPRRQTRILPLLKGGPGRLGKRRKSSRQASHGGIPGGKRTRCVAKVTSGQPFLTGHCTRTPRRYSFSIARQVRLLMEHQAAHASQLAESESARAAVESELEQWKTSLHELEECVRFASRDNPRSSLSSRGSAADSLDGLAVFLRSDGLMTRRRRTQPCAKKLRPYGRVAQQKFPQTRG